MSFLNAALLLGGLAATIPVLIHLLSRRRQRKVEWGAMFLIEQVVRDDRRRLQFRQWLLLAMRCLAVLLLAAAMARPVLTHVRSQGAGDATASVIVIDDGPTMTATGADGRTSFDAATSAAARLADALAETGEVRVVTAAGETLDVAHIDDIEPTAAPADLARAVTAARAYLADAPALRRRVFLLSDLAHIDGPSTGDDMTLVRVGDPPRDRPNVAVTDVELRPALLSPGEPVDVLATVTNTGPVAADAVRVSMSVAGVTRDRRTVALPPGGESVVLFRHSFDSPGRAVVEVKAEADGDPMPAGDSFALIADVPARLPAVVLPPSRDRPFGENPGDFVRLALSAGAGIAVGDDDDPALLVVAGGEVPADADPDAATLAFAGDAADAWPDWLPARPVEVVEGDARLAAGPYADPLLRPWNEAGADLSNVTATRRWRLEPADGARVVLRFADGLPAVVVRDAAAVVALPADGTWSDLPLRAGFLPLVQQLAGHVIGQTRPAATFRAGDTIALSGPATVRTPDGDRLDVEQMQFRLSRPGVYAIVPEDGDPTTVAANLPPEATRLPAGGIPPTDLDALLASLDESERGREVWRPAVVALLGLMFAELLLAGRLDREVVA